MDITYEEFMRENGDQLDAPDVPIFTFYEIIKASYINFAGIIQMFSRLN